MEKVDDLNARMEQLEDEKRDLEEKRQHLDLPALDKDMPARLVDNFEEVMAAGTNPQKKDLLRHLVKKVLIHDRRTIEIWYALPNQVSVSTPAHLAPRGGLEPHGPAGLTTRVVADHRLSPPSPDSGEMCCATTPRHATMWPQAFAVRQLKPASA